MKLNPHDVVNPRCLKCRKRGSAHRVTFLPPDAENTIRMERWCRTGSRTGNRYLPQRMTEAEVDVWAKRLSGIYSLRNTDS